MDVLELPTPKQGLFSPLRAKPQLLILELAWRWFCGGLLLCVAGYEGFRLWTASLPALRASGVLSLGVSQAATDPLQFLTALSSSAPVALSILMPQVSRACLGLAPLAIFCWALAFGFGRSAVLTSYDWRLARRPWLLASSEALRLVLLLGFSWLWTALLPVLSRVRLQQGQPSPQPNAWLYGCLLVACTAVCILVPLLFVRLLHTGTCLALCQPSLGLRTGCALAWSTRRQRQFRAGQAQVRRKSRRAGLLVAAVGLFVSLLPAPFAGGAPLYLWWAALTLVLLAATDALRLGSLLLQLDQVRALPSSPAR
jgi:hypothetical protein